MLECCISDTNHERNGMSYLSWPTSDYTGMAQNMRLEFIPMFLIVPGQLGSLNFPTSPSLLDKKQLPRIPIKIALSDAYGILILGRRLLQREPQGRESSLPNTPYLDQRTFVPYQATPMRGISENWRKHSDAPPMLPLRRIRGHFFFSNIG